jgi:flagellar FliJ protein
VLRFRFRLERFLEIRRHRERLAELALAAATSRCLELQNRMADAKARMARELVDRAASGRLDLEQWQWSEAYRRRLADAYEAGARDLVVREQERRQAQKAYLEAARERKVLDKLRERRERDYYHEEKRREARTLDDVSQSGRVGRSLAGSPGTAGLGPRGDAKSEE